MAPSSPVESLIVEYSTQPPIYYPGQLVTGNVHLELKEATQFGALRLEFEGKAFVQWNQSDGNPDGEQYQTFQNERTYFTLSLLLWEGFESSTEMPAGDSSFPFQFTLPAEIPPSYEHENGVPEAFVRYLCRASIDAKTTTSRKTTTTTTTTPFTVVFLYNLNMAPNARQVMQATNSMKPGLCCRRGTTTITLNAPKSGYVVGEEVFVQAQISNLSNKKLTGSQLALVQEILFLGKSVQKTWGGDHPTMTQRKLQTFATVKNDKEIEAGEETSVSFQMTIPRVMSSGLPFCDIIVIQYNLCLSVKLKRSMRELMVQAPVVIGNIPLRSHITEPNKLPPHPPQSLVTLPPTTPNEASYIWTRRSSLHI